jgi:DnaK suppressor protein
MLITLDLQQIRKALEKERQDLLRSLHDRDSYVVPMETPDQVDLANSLELLEIKTSLDQLSRQKIERINQALARIDNGTYGVCLKCGEAILPERLIALPYAELCVNCQARVEGRGQAARKSYASVFV